MQSKTKAILGEEKPDIQTRPAKKVDTKRGKKIMQKDGDFTSTKVLNISSFRKKVEVKRYLVWIIIAVFIVLSAIPLIADFIFIKRVISNTENF